MTFKVVPLSAGQLLDVRGEDILNEGLFRSCDSYRGGGGYDKFPEIAYNLLGRRYHKQFIVQLYGCSLDCPYCYVTRAGVWSSYKNLSARELATYFENAYESHGTTVFHLMGGAPALYLKQWPDLLYELERLRFNWIFHSDFMLTEGRYSQLVLKYLASNLNCLFAVNIKGVTDEEYIGNTRKHPRWSLFWSNLDALIYNAVPFYITFTGISDPEPFWINYSKRWPHRVRFDRQYAFNIPIIQYKAVPHVDEIPWGKQR